ncbi:MAG TPA: hypothetical protein VFD58_31845 [Blastocatellia bacterium]|nr:hypothetical protein [Blastocatellia bacterium]
MYYPDLTPYEYLKGCIDSDTLNVGWLDKAHDYVKGETPCELLNWLFTLCLSPVNKTRGFHKCTLCKASGFGLTVQADGKEILLGSAEIRIRANNVRVFASPDLIYHYVKDHHYKPPDEFIVAVLNQSLNSDLL